MFKKELYKVKSEKAPFRFLFSYVRHISMMVAKPVVVDYERLFEITFSQYSCSSIFVLFGFYLYEFCTWQFTALSGSVNFHAMSFVRKTDAQCLLTHIWWV